jgi:hypothetical protein
VVIGRVVHEATGFYKESLNRSMTMTVPIMGPNTNFKSWKRNFLTFLSPKAAYPIPQLVIRESGDRLDEVAHTYAYAMLFHATIDNKRDDHVVKCVFSARHGYATAAWDILCERLDSRSFSRSLSLLDNLMLRQRPVQSLTEYVHFMRQTFDDYKETYEMTNGCAAIHPHNLGLLMLCGISSTGHFGQAKQCIIRAFDTNYLLSADEVVASILHMAQNMDKDVHAQGQPALDGYAPPISAFVGAACGSNNGRGHNPRGTRGGRGLPNKCSACDIFNHIKSF